jgi:hypothetical protein
LRLPDSSPSPSPLVGESDVSRGCPRLDGTRIICAPYPRRWLPPASSQEPKSTARLWTAIRRCAGVISTTCGGNNRIRPLRPPATTSDSQRRDEACAHSAWIGATSEQNDHLRVSIVRPRTRRAPRAASRPRSSSVPVRERRPGRPSGHQPRCRRCHGEGSVAVQWGTSGTSATPTATSGSSPPTPEPLGSEWREPRSPVASGKGRRVRGRRRTHTRRRRTARRTGMHSWPSRSPVREAS